MFRIWLERGNQPSISAQPPNNTLLFRFSSSHTWLWQSRIQYFVCYCPLFTLIFSTKVFLYLCQQHVQRRFQTMCSNILTSQTPQTPQITHFALISTLFVGILILWKKSTKHYFHVISHSQNFIDVGNTCDEQYFQRSTLFITFL